MQHQLNDHDRAVIEGTAPELYWRNQVRVAILRMRERKPPFILASDRHRAYQISAEGRAYLLENESFIMPGEIANSSNLIEGAVRQITVNAYERNPEAKKQCLQYYGTTCLVCGFSFGAVYGPLADGFIHVHHVKPLSEIGQEYEVDPVADLRPVCPNCHALIHLGGECRSIEDVRRLVDPRVLSFWESFA
jgi:predicted HNH restriction endonuclease